MSGDEPAQAAFPAEQLRDDFLANARGLARYWSELPDKTPLERTEGLLFSVLVMIDGGSGGFPCALDLVARPHPDDKAYHQAEGEPWVEDGTVLNASDQLHELLARDPA